MAKFLDLDNQDGKLDAALPANLVGATDHYELQQAEQILAGVRAWEVRTHQAHLPGDFGAAHLADIHAYVVQDVYPIVGETRTDTLALDKAQKLVEPTFKISIPATHRAGAGGEVITLLPADQVNLRLDQLAQWLVEAHYLRGLKKPEFVERFTHTYVEYARAHPFEQGTQPVLIAAMGLLGELAGYQVDIGLAPTLQRETDALLANAAAGDPRRLQAALTPFITEDESEVGILSRRITMQVIKPKLPPGI